MEQQKIDLDLDRLVARFGQRIAQAELQAEVAQQRAERAEAAVADLTARLEALEGDDPHQD